MPHPQISHVVIVGASVAGVKLAQCLRSEGFTGAVTLVDAEDDPLYDKPPLSKDYLSGVSSAPEIALTTLDDLNAREISARFGVSAVSLDPATKTLALSDGSELSYDALVIATGARARLTPWASLPGVHVLRTRADADELRKEIVAGRHLAVIGAGFVGAEAAATALKAGLRVTIIEPLGAPMGRAMNAEVGGIFADKHRHEGAEFRFGISVERVEPIGERCRLLLTDGSALDVDAVLLGIGAVANTEWLQSSGVSIDNGIVCDATLAAVGVPDVYAIGDVARFTNDRHPDSVRLEHWTSAADQALLVAHNIAHPDDPRSYNPTEYVWSDQYDWKIQIVGLTGSDHWTIVGDPAADRFAIVYGVDTQPVQGVVIVNWPRALIDSRRSVASAVATGDLTERLRRLLVASKAAV
ncbi:NAD(P)/FAD-dependent oxidoreductase [Microbacterium sp. PAMC21962]|uniref:NAD(P)/FAD-dependent oxidoreductase n=1 Tax=Microbacterium sp. PAMC21962 TaxID=2861280 RepID=UPI001C62491C|nr:FAD-dependent oxidoreductase [Microbacterium sp. PAMC21962]QYF97098.1 FAD-dependent oxidoreductase [Microbacterium sp. PAMC21962]